MFPKSLEFSSPSSTVAIVLGNMRSVYPEQSIILEALAFMLTFGPVERFDCLLDYDALAFSFYDPAAAMTASSALPNVHSVGRYSIVHFGFLNAKLSDDKAKKLTLPGITYSNTFAHSDSSPTSNRSSIRALDDSDFVGVAFNGGRSPARYGSSRAAQAAPTVELLQERQQLDIDPYNISRDVRCTLMIRNLPKGMTQADFFERFSSKLPRVDEVIDFVYMPYDSVKQQNFGYVFLNARDLDKVGIIYRTFHGKALFTDSTQTKSCQVAYARLQGRDKFIAQFNRDAVLKLPKQLRPLILETPLSTSLIGVNGRSRTDSASTKSGESVWRNSIISETHELDDTGKIAEAVAEFAFN